MGKIRAMVAAGAGGLAVWTGGMVMAADPAPDPARADGLRIEVTYRGEGREGRASVSVRGRRVRIEQRTPGEKTTRHVLLYQGDRDRFLSIDPSTRAYVAVDRDLIATASLPARAARREVDAQLGRLPASQHAAVERLLGIRETGRTLADLPIHVRRVEGSDRVGKLRCTRRELVRDDKPIAELCVVDWRAVGIAPVDLVVFRQLANFQRELMGARDLTPLAFVPDQGFEWLVQFDGFPLYLRGVDGGSLAGEIRVTAVEPLVADAAHFEPPPDYSVRSAYSILFGDPERPAAPDPR